MTPNLNQIPDKVVSLFPPVVIDTPGGRFAVYGDAGWFPVDKKFKQSDALARWEKWKPSNSQNNPNSPSIGSQHQWDVMNSKGTGTYSVTYKESNKTWGCSCKGWIFHQNRDCKHIAKIKRELVELK